MNLDELVRSAHETMAVRRVYAEPLTQGGITLIAAAKVGGAVGGGGGHDAQGQEGQGGGFGIQSRPAGAFVIKDGAVRWMPAVDPNRMISVVGLVAITALVTRVRVERIRAKSRGRG